MLTIFEGVPCSASTSKPVAITVILISSFNVSSITAPKMIFASGSADSLTTSAASYTSSAPKSPPPVKLSITPVAPFIEVSKSGEAIAC